MFPVWIASGRLPLDSVGQMPDNDVQSASIQVLAMAHRTASRRSRTLLIVLWTCLFAAGCQSVPHWLRMEEVDGAKSVDPWTTQAGSEGRAGRKVDKESDPLNLKKFMMSEKALEIERNCGVE